MKLAIICPITSKGCGTELFEQPVHKSLLPSIVSISMSHEVDLYFGYDHNDPVWHSKSNRKRTSGRARWERLVGLTGDITGIWNEMWKRTEGEFDYLLPANDDLAFQFNPLSAIPYLKKQNDFGIVPFADSAFPGWPTFYVVSKVHFMIFPCLYPLPWKGAHQDSWIADVYRPWGASEIQEELKVHNHIGITEPRFEYGGTEQYYEVVMNGRRKVNEWLKTTSVIPLEPLPEEKLVNTSILI